MPACNTPHNNMHVICSVRVVKCNKDLRDIVNIRNRLIHKMLGNFEMIAMCASYCVPCSQMYEIMFVSSICINKCMNEMCIKIAITII